METQETIAAWAAATFGPTTVSAAWLRCFEEILEAEKADLAGDHEGLAAELPDILITLYRVAERLGVDLHSAVNEKMAVNRGRTWNVSPNGTGRHV
jgi:NTP pyrophosphatase (non-canonical NTP hydrolase)